MKTFSIGGIHPNDNKLSAGKKIVNVDIPKQAIIPLEQHLGAPTVPVVAKGDKVLVGQLIGKANGFVSANIHSSVSGTVLKVDEVVDAWGYLRPAIFIDVEGDEWCENIIKDNKIQRGCKYTPAEIIEKIKEAGVVGLGGACFPTHIKLSPPPGKTAEVLIINAVECEPYLTCDHQLMMEHAEEIFIGISILMKALSVPRAIIGIESNKMDAIQLFRDIAEKNMGIEVMPLKMQYPQGGEKQLIDAVIGRQVPSGAIPIEVGAVVQNVATAFAVYEAVQKNKPLIERVITITGKDVKNPGNFRIRVGTPLGAALELAGGMPESTGKIVGGGPMMGRAFVTTDVPATKRSSGLLMFDQESSKRAKMLNCVRCAKCVSACPMGLEPYLLANLSERKQFDGMEKERIYDCIECGCCSYSCPSNRPLLDFVRIGKADVMQIMRNRK